MQMPCKWILAENVFIFSSLYWQYRSVTAGLVSRSSGTRRQGAETTLRHRSEAVTSIWFELLVHFESVRTWRYSCLLPWCLLEEGCFIPFEKRWLKTTVPSCVRERQSLLWAVAEFRGIGWCWLCREPAAPLYSHSCLPQHLQHLQRASHHCGKSELGRAAYISLIPPPPFLLCILHLPLYCTLQLWGARGVIAFCSRQLS